MRDPRKNRGNVVDGDKKFIEGIVEAVHDDADDQFPPFQNGAAPYWREWLSHPGYDEFWREADAVARAGNVKVPVLHMTSWYDTCLRGHLDFAKALAERSDPGVRDKHRLILGPWDHSAYYNKRPTCAGQRDFGPDVFTGPELLGSLALGWFDHWLRGEPLKVLPENGVRYYQMGENVGARHPRTACALPAQRRAANTA